MADEKGMDWLEVCAQCAFCSLRLDINGTCHHPLNDKYSCLGYRQDNKKIMGIFKPKERRCGKGAIFFQPSTPESIQALKEKEEAILAERKKEIEKEEESYGRIENVLDRHIREVLYERGYDICSCNHITFNYRNQEGRGAVIRALLDRFDIKEKRPKE